MSAAGFDEDDVAPRRRRRARRRRAPASYEQRIILFVDFLGFGDLVRRSVEEAGLLDRLLSAMDAVGRIGAGHASSSQRITQFSDSIVVSYRADETSAAFWLLTQIAFCVIDLAERGFLLRGAVTVGQLLHDDDHVVGPAMVRAYEMESCEAKYPRVIVDPVLLQVARSHARDHSPSEEEEFVRSYLATDGDGRLFFDYISWASVVGVTGGDDARYPAYMQRLSSLIEDGLRHDTPAVLRKYLWLHACYLKALRVFDAPRGAYANAYPDQVEAIRRLPRLTSLARTARGRVARG